MKSRLDKLLEDIDPVNIYDVVSSSVDAALNSFTVPKGIIDDWNEYETILAKFYRHAENSILNINDFSPTNDSYGLTASIRLLNKEYGESGQKAAFELVRTGQRGGIYYVLKKIGKQLIYEYVDRWVSTKIYTFWSSLSNEEKSEVVDEYVLKHGQLLPSELIEGYAVRIRMNFPKVLEEHPRLIRNLRMVNVNEITS
jgi:hypothetical protein